MKNVFKFLDVKHAEQSMQKDNLYDFLLKKEYKKQQEITFWSVFIAYMVFYFTRNQWTVFGTHLVDDTHALSHAQYALVGLFFSISYGISKFISSPLSDTKSNRWLLGLGLIGAGIANALFGLSWISFSSVLAPIIVSCVLQVIIGWIHSFGATPCVRFFYNWFPHKQRRDRIITWNVSANIGGAIASFVIFGSYSLMSDTFGNWAYFILPSVISIIVGLFVILLAKDKPETAGLPSLQAYYNLKLIGQQQGKTLEPEKPWSHYFVKYVLKNKFIWFLAISNLLVYTVRMGLSDWTLQYLKEVGHYDIKEEGKWLYALFNWGAVVLTLTVGLAANRYLKKFTLITIIVTLIGSFALIGIWLIKANSIVWLAIFLLLSGIIFIPQCFLPIMVSEFSHHRVVSTSAGILGIAGYAGDALMSKLVIGVGLLSISWDAVFIFLIVCGIVGAAVLIPLRHKALNH